MFVLRESVSGFNVLFENDAETIGKFRTYEEARAFLEDYAKRVPYVTYVRIVDTEYKRREEWYTWGKDGKLLQPYKRGN